MKKRNQVQRMPSSFLEILSRSQRLALRPTRLAREARFTNSCPFRSIRSYAKKPVQNERDPLTGTKEIRPRPGGFSAACTSGTHP